MSKRTFERTNGHSVSRACGKLDKQSAGGWSDGQATGSQSIGWTGGRWADGQIGRLVGEPRDGRTGRHSVGWHVELWNEQTEKGLIRQSGGWAGGRTNMQ